jgi:N-carbamoylputrescine amidase
MIEKLRVAANQVTSLDGEPERNLANAAMHVERAAKAGAKLALGPEFLAAGYVYDESIWRSAEPADGRTETCRRDVAQQAGTSGSCGAAS